MVQQSNGKDIASRIWRLIQMILP